MKKSILSLTALILSLSPLITIAHTRWFIGEEPLPLPPIQEPTTLYLGSIAAISALIILIGIIIEKKDWLQLNFLKPKSAHAFEHAASTFTMVTGAFLIIAGTHEYLFSPNITHNIGIPMLMIVLQICIGIAFLLGIGARIAALVLISLWALALPITGALTMAEDIWIVSTSLFILTMGNDYFSIISFSFLRKIFKPLHHWGLSLLRIGTGGTLLILGFSEKILAPELGLNFLQQYDWNFMSKLGINYSDYLFTFSAGATESLLGLLLLLGITTRLTALTIGILFTIPLFILGPLEISGHMPHFAAIILIILFGGGTHFRPFKK